MSRINIVQQRIKELEGGRFQKMCDTYLFTKYGLENITTLGSQDGTDKTTRGVPDSYVEYDDGTYTFIMYGTHQDVKEKIKKDIQDCLDVKATGIEISKIRKIICCHTSTNISTKQNEIFKQVANGVELQLIGLSTLGEDIASPKFQSLANDFLSVPFGTEQIFDIEGFINAYNADVTASPMNRAFKFRERELLQLTSALEKNNVALVTGVSGVGKSRISLEVCKKFREISYEVLCVKNNGQNLHNDFKIATSEPGNYLIFIDDINLVTNLQPIINWIIENNNKTTKFKILGTVRDYAQKEVSNSLTRIGNVEKVIIPNFTDEELREIIIDCLNIKNSNFQNRILEIAQGNARLAVLAGQLAINQVEKINNPAELFKNYYSGIIDEGQISIDSIKVLFIIALLNTVNIEQDKLAQLLLSEFEISERKFYDIIDYLNQKELVDLYLNQIVKINDQSFRDYILEYVIVEHKYIGIDKLLKLGFKINKKKIIYALNTITNLFRSKQTISYISEQVNNQWNTVNDEENLSYLESFYSLNYPKAIRLIDNKIDKMSNNSFQITQEYVEQHKNYQIIKSLEMNILSNFKNTNFFRKAIQLSLKLLDKRPDYFMDIYFSFTKNFAYDKFSASSDYKQELTLLNDLYSSTNEEQLNHYYVLLEVIKVLLMTSTSNTEAKKGGHTIISYNINVELTQGAKQLREKIWTILANLYSKTDLQNEVLKIIATSHWIGEKSKVTPIVEFDMSCIKKHFINNWNTPSLDQALALTALSNNAKSFIEVNHYFENYSNVSGKKYYDVLKPRNFHDTWKNNQNILSQQIMSLTKDFVLSDYHNLVQLAIQLEQVSTNEQGLIGNNLKIALENVPEHLLEAVLTDYLKAKAPFSLICFSIISNLLNKLEFKILYKLLNQFEFPNKNRWISIFFDSIPAKDINAEKVRLLVQFIESQDNENSPYIPRLETIIKYMDFDNNIITEVAQKVNLLSNKENSLANNFICGYFSDPVNLAKIFEKNISILEQLYPKIDQQSFDYEYSLLIEIIKVDPTFWEKYLIFLKEDTRIQSDLFIQIWELDNYNELIDIAFKNLILNTKSYDLYNIYDVVFAIDNANSSLLPRIRKWLVDYIKKNIKNKTQIQNIFRYYISNQNVETRQYFIQIFLKSDSDIDDFKKIDILPTSYSFSNSEVPLIDADIDFLTHLTSCDFIKNFFDHELYIHDMIAKKCQYKRQIQLKEYQEDLY
ncbi:AAA family ATPase [Leuconostoc suionicum]|uniref:AAA family ATPase n=1 Tax=Leuconostoc suionicum TaxID=1511761 RepID=UPI0024ACEE8E|nr:AAA family ATPase [Leuconostoc suionicum]MDI6502438.1 AAA family ATPase [Leuconostoc suionicum]